MKNPFASSFRERNYFMKDKFDIAATAASDSLVMYVHAAPSLRVPVTPANRTLLRRLRAAELSDWEAGRMCSRDYSTAKPGSLVNHRI
jgi:hypothetical protein